MQGELDIPQDRGVILLSSLLEDKIVKTFLTSKAEQDSILDKASLEVADLDRDESRSFYRIVINGLAQADAYWTQDRRDVTLELLPLIGLGKIRSEDILEDYMAAVSTQTRESDIYGTIDALLSAGEIVATNLPMGEDTRLTLKTCWLRVARNFPRKDSQPIIDRVDNFIAQVPIHPEDLLGNPDIRLGYREAPDFPPQQKALHDKYLEVAGAQGTFKLALWENTPQFREACIKQGVNLEKFWNISDPDQVAGAIETIKGGTPMIVQSSLDQALRRTIGLSLDEITDEQTRVLADEVTRIAASASNDILQGIRSFDMVIGRFKELAEKVKDSPARAQRAVLGPILKFFQENGIDVAGVNFSRIGDLLNDQTTLTKAEEEYNKKQQERVNAASALRQTFHTANMPVNFSLASRAREDLFLGDLTGDCTAYHLVVGMNAWTVPVWLSNPGFNFYKITDGDTLIAKLGLLLSVADDKPAIVVDSIETGTEIKDEEAASKLITQGLSYLRTWATRIGVGNVYMNEVSNSSGLTDVTHKVVRSSSTKSLYAMGGLSGLAEVRKNLIHQEETAGENIYLQSRSAGYWDEEPLVTTERSKLLEEFEKTISETLNMALADERTIIENASREKNWQDLFDTILKIRYPTVAKLLGTQWETYDNFIASIPIASNGKVDIDSMPFGRDTLPVSTAIDAKLIDEKLTKGVTPELQTVILDDDIEDERQIIIEAAELDEFLVVLREMQAEEMTPELALDTLYGQVKEEKDTKEKPAVPLNRNMPVIKI